MQPTSNWNIIRPEDYYPSNGLGHLLLGASTYAEADALYAVAEESVRQAALPFIPLLENTRWSGTLMELKTHLGERGRVASLKNARLRNWINTQRHEANSGKLSQAKREILEGLLPQWAGVGKIDGIWETSLLDYVLYVRRNHRTPRSASDDHHEELLSTWMSNQKTFLRKGKLSAERIALLDLFAPGWKSRQRPRPEWDEMFDRLKAFVHEQGRFPMPSGGNYDEAFLSTWMTRQREIRSAQRDKKNAERTARLDRELPDWRNPLDAEWKKKLALVKDHVETHGRLPLHSERLPNEHKLGEWLQAQRLALKLRGMHKERMESLDAAAPGWREKPDVNKTKRLVKEILAAQKMSS